jgi:hypothetical protein
MNIILPFVICKVKAADQKYWFSLANAIDTNLDNPFANGLNYYLGILYTFRENQ